MIKVKALCGGYGPGATSLEDRIKSGSDLLAVGKLPLQVGMEWEFSRMGLPSWIIWVRFRGLPMDASIDHDGSAEASAYLVRPTCGQNPQGRLHQLLEDIALQRSRASAGQLAQAERMVKRSRLEHVPCDPGDNMAILIPLVDRGKDDPRNVVHVILVRNENGMYRIGVGDGILKGRYSRSYFDICRHQLKSIDEVSADKDIGLRQAVQQSSMFGGQGYAKCNCTAGKKQCQTNRCKSYKGRKCNSR
ncbi:uncharacterized protein [Palaemon carinicauda]|uniref:uncharacterized protein n=1 Tax=Palaemon carinicauda TaxID=392227 RepID=UPI0035B674CE